MTDPLTLVTVALAHNSFKPPPLFLTPPFNACKSGLSGLQPMQLTAYQAGATIQPESGTKQIEFSHPPMQLPRSNRQLYRQRFEALKRGQLYTRLPPGSFRAAWAKATQQPTYQQWRELLAREAAAVAKGQGNNRLSVILGDSLSLWFPSDRLPQNQFWLNQSLSGDTTTGILHRLSAFAKTRPTVIYVMAGINDLKQGTSNAQILKNLSQIIARLQQTHPQAQIVLQSILPTRSARFSNERIVQLNHQLEDLAFQNHAFYLDLYSQMTDNDGNLHPDLTTDGVHLNARGYETWQMALSQADGWMAMGR